MELREIAFLATHKCTNQHLNVGIVGYNEVFLSQKMRVWLLFPLIISLAHPLLSALNEGGLPEMRDPIQ